MADLNKKLDILALEKLLDYTASGIGAGPMLVPWKACKEGEVQRVSAQAEADARLLQATADTNALRMITEAQSKARQFLHTPIELERPQEKSG